MNWETHQILITVKAYPNPSRKYGETVCVAGISLNTKQFLRLYPIPYRDLDQSKKFAKYNIIEARITKAADDKRPESYKINTDTIKIIDWLDTKDKWSKRKKYILSIVDKSMCEILKQQSQSLGIIKPKQIDFYHTKAKPKDGAKREECYAQLSFYNKSKSAIEAIPFEFRYKFFCAGESDCPGHDYLIIDWEIGQSYRDWRWKYRDENLLLEKIRQKWFDQICALKNDIYFYVGNLHRFQDTFMVLGAFYPPK